MYHHQRAATFNDDWQDWPPDMSSDTSSEFEPALWPARHADAPMVRKNRPSRPPKTSHVAKTYRMLHQ